MRKCSKMVTLVAKQSLKSHVCDYKALIELELKSINTLMEIESD